MSRLPKISLVTPSYNQGEFLEGTITSVLNQNYPDLEYIIMDGGSTDGSQGIIERHADSLAYWQSAKDDGQYSAIQNGFERSTGEVMAWINSDDMYFPWALRVVGEIFAAFPEIEWITSLYPTTWNRGGVPFDLYARQGHSRKFFLKGLRLADPEHPDRFCIQQESTFWRRSLWDRAGGTLSMTEGLAADFELWARFFEHAELVGVRSQLGGFRFHGDQRSLATPQTYTEEAETVLERHGGYREHGLAATMRKVGLGRHWPLSVLPSLGFVQVVHNVTWHVGEGRWRLVREATYE